MVRGSVPEAVDAAVARALDKTPADRFPSAGEFAHALEAKAATPAAATVVTAAPRSRRGWMLGAGAAVLVAAAALGAWLLAGRKPAHQAQAYVLRDRTQLTSSGNVFASAVSPDGKQLAYITHNCAPAGCRYAVDLQDVGGGSATHRVLDGATAAYGLEWSPDRRNLIFVGTLRGRWGFYLVSALGGPPRYLSSGAAMFWAGGDSLLVGPPLSGGDSVFQVKVTSIDGAIADSIRIPGPGGGVAALSVSPGGRWIVALVLQSGRGLWQVLDRQGKVADRVVNSCTCPGRITRDALWLTRSGVGAESIVRIGIDSATGRLATEQDTLLSGNFNNFSVTADGSSLVIDDGTRDYSLWAVRLPDALRGRYDETQRLVRTSTELYAQLSPDGARVLLGRNVPSSAGGDGAAALGAALRRRERDPAQHPGHAPRQRVVGLGDAERDEPDGGRAARSPGRRADRRRAAVARPARLARAEPGPAAGRMGLDPVVARPGRGATGRSEDGDPQAAMVRRDPAPHRRRGRRAAGDERVERRQL